MFFFFLLFSTPCGHNKKDLFSRGPGPQSNLPTCCPPLDVGFEAFDFSKADTADSFGLKLARVNHFCVSFSD